jgi:hypothetical protein
LTDIFEEVEEDLRRDRFNEFWHRHRWAIFGAAALIVAGTGGIVKWRDWQRQADQALGAEFAAADALAGTDAAKAASQLEVLGSGGEQGYRLLARFQAAILKVKGSDRPGGLAALDAIAADGGVDQAWRDLAAMLSALQQVDTLPRDELVARLARLAVAPGPWRFTAEELTALADLRAGDRPAALKLYQQLADDLDAPQAARARAAKVIEALRQQG